MDYEMMWKELNEKLQKSISLLSKDLQHEFKTYCRDNNRIDGKIEGFKVVDGWMKDIKKSLK